MFATPWRGVSLSGGEPSAEAWQAYRAQSRYRGAQWEEHGHLRSSRRSPWPRDCCTFSPKIHTVGPGKAELLEARCEQMLTPVDPGKAELLRMCANSAMACESTASVHDSELLRHIPELLCDPHLGKLLSELLELLNELCLAGVGLLLLRSELPSEERL
eukprot:7388516-Prymnesium_polylepis.1